MNIFSRNGIREGDSVAIVGIGFMWNWRGIDVINAHERDPMAYTSGIQEAIRALENGSLDPSPLYTHTFPLERLAEGFAIMQSRPEGYFKGMVSI